MSIIIIIIISSSSSSNIAIISIPACLEAQ